MPGRGTRTGSIDVARMSSVLTASWTPFAAIIPEAPVLKHASVWPWPQAAYGWCMLGAIGLSVFFWSRLARSDERLLVIYGSALLAAFLGAKLVYIFSEGWISPDGAVSWRTWWTGKSILG